MSMRWKNSMAQDSIQSYSACEQNAGYATRNKKSYNTSKDLRVLGTIGIINIASKHGILIHLYADDTQLYIKLSAKDIVNAKSRLLACFSDIQAWCASMRLKLNASKTELIWFNRLLTPATEIPHTILNLGPDCSIKPSDVVRDLGVLLDNTLSLKFQIASITKSCFFHLRRIRQV